MWWCGEDINGPEWLGEADESPGEASICELPFIMTLAPCGLCGGGSMCGDEPDIEWTEPGVAEAGVIA